MLSAFLVRKARIVPVVLTVITATLAVVRAIMQIIATIVTIAMRVMVAAIIKAKRVKSTVSAGSCAGLGPTDPKIFRA